MPTPLMHTTAHQAHHRRRRACVQRGQSCGAGLDTPELFGSTTVRASAQARLTRASGHRKKLAALFTGMFLFRQQMLLSAIFARISAVEMRLNYQESCLSRACLTRVCGERFPSAFVVDELVCLMYNYLMYTCSRCNSPACQSEVPVDYEPVGHLLRLSSVTPCGRLRLRLALAWAPGKAIGSDTGESVRPGP